MNWIEIVVMAAVSGLGAWYLYGVWERGRIKRGGVLPSTAAVRAPTRVPSSVPVPVLRILMPPEVAAEELPAVSRTIPPPPLSETRRVTVRWACAERLAAFENLPLKARERLTRLASEGGPPAHERVLCPCCSAEPREPCDRQAAADARDLATLRQEVASERETLEPRTQVMQVGGAKR